MNSKQNVKCKIAVDVMGGDFGPMAAIEGVYRTLEHYPNVECVLFGDQEKIKHCISSYLQLKRISIVHAEGIVNCDDKPSSILRNSKNTSMRLAIESVKNKETDMVVSSGNTGALMVISKLLLKTLSGITRPAIIAMIPTIKGTPTALVDAGANSQCNTDMLLDFAVMGDAFAKILFNISSPRVALLNIGIEDIKGTEAIKEAMSELIKINNHLNIKGYVEGDGIVDGSVDVVVTDGFTGNVALKTIEGTAKLCEHYLKLGFSNSFWSKLGYLLAKRSFKEVFKKIDRRSYNGAMLVGLTEIVIKSHGSADGVAFFHAMNKAIDLFSNRVNDKIVEELGFYIKEDKTHKEKNNT